MSRGSVVARLRTVSDEQVVGHGGCPAVAPRVEAVLLDEEGEVLQGEGKGASPEVRVQERQPAARHARRWMIMGGWQAATHSSIAERPSSRLRKRVLTKEA